MKRLTLLVLCVAALVAPASAAARLPVAARLSACTPGATAAERSFDVAARMRRIAGARRMAIRFDVGVRYPGEARYHAVRAAGFRVWLKSSRRAGSYERYRTVNGLEAPARYRVRVGFRWYRRDGRVLKTVSRVTRSCFEPDPRPDLRFAAARSRVLLDGRVRFAVDVRNTGFSSSGPSAVTLRAADGTEQAKALPALAPGEQVTRTWVRAACAPDFEPLAVLDPEGTVDERREADNARRLACPGR